MEPDRPDHFRMRQVVRPPKSLDIPGECGPTSSLRKIHPCGQSLDVNDHDELSRRLWLLREQLEQLVGALDIQQLVLANNRLRWLPMVSENVETLVSDIRTSEAERVLLSRRVARSLGLGDDATLVELADAVGDPSAAVWRRHRLHLIALHAEIDDIASSNRELGTRWAAATQEVLISLGGDAVDTYDPSGGTQPLTPTSPRFDRTA
jgi:FlgN protein